MPSAIQQQMSARAAAEQRFEHFERLNPDGVASWQLAALQEQLAHTLTASPFYRQTLAGQTAALGSLEELTKLPFTTKQDLRDCYPDLLIAVTRDELIRYGESTGTTGRPTSSAVTYADWVAGNIAVERSLGAFFGPQDLTFISIPYELAFASYDIDRALEAVGCAVVSTGSMSLVCPFERMVEMMWTVRPTGLVCTPTRALRLYDMLAASGRDPRQVGLRTFLYVGETCSPAKLSKIAELWGVTLVTAYGSTETNSLGLQCPAGSVHLTEDRHIFEVIDPESTLPVPDGTAGELVLTSIATRAMPLIRYRTGDDVHVVPQACVCGSPRRRIVHHGRVVEQLVVDGRRINKMAVEQEILSVPGSGMYYASGSVGDRIGVRVEVLPGSQDVPERVAAAVRERFGVECTAEPVSRESVMTAMDRMLKPGSLSLEQLVGLP